MRKLALSLLLLSLSAGALANDTGQDPKAVIRHAMAKLMPSPPDSIKPSGIAGLYEVRFGPQLLYATPDGRYVFHGDVIDLKQQVNITEQRRNGARAAALADLSEKSMIVYAPKGQAKHTITVFTDIDCPYCRKLHRELKQINALGIRVRYLAYPRAGVHSHSYEKAVSVWCADNRQAAMTQAMEGAEPKPATCKDSPVKHDMALAQMMGVQGTPAIVLDDGRMIPGYVPAKRLAQILAQE